MVRELCKYRFRAAFGVWALWCGGAPFGRFPSRLRRRGSHLGGGGAAVGRLGRGERTGCGGLLCEGASAFAFALPHPAHGASPISGQGRGGRQAVAGRTLGTSPISGRGRGRRRADAGRTHGTSPISGRRHGRRQAVAGRTHGQERGLPCALPPLHTVIRHTSGRGTAVGGQVRGTARGGVRLCPRPPPPCARRRGTRGHNGATSFPERRGHSPGAVDGRTIYYIYACAGARARTFCTGWRATMWITFPWITHCG